MRLTLAIAAALLALPVTVQAADPAAGEKVFRKCKACHAVGEGAKNKVGPQLNGLIGRTAGTVEGYKYSTANAESGVVWTEEALDEYLKNPRQYMKGTKMAFPGLKKDDERADVIAYLAQFK